MPRKKKEVPVTPKPTVKPRGNPELYNPRSRDNLVQYTQKQRKQKQEKIMGRLASELDGYDLDPDVLDVIIPMSKIFSETERHRFVSYLLLYVEEFGKNAPLSISDIDDIAQLCKNKILEDRVLEEAKKDTDRGVQDFLGALDKLKKENAKLKEQLAANRSIRVDPRANGNITILDIIADYEAKGADELQRKLDDLHKEEEEEVPKGAYKTSVEDMIR